MPRNPDADTFVAALGHPLEKEIQAVRRIVLGVDRRIAETIKWKSPTFVFEGNIASIEPRSKKQVSVLFHQGAEGPGGSAEGLDRAQGRMRPGPIPFAT